ncbi:hypothetical protein [Simplicispira suum]|uniref:Uncharacterized protein n=1 Tax=Simplicispira suum TaxID=2109915 RepID=A0A2S0N3K2_9BURK|nr:hypothetical protein [Simplicispira suum]AVO42720.1 hypothetical protein C6571_16740 [Simplicispira suum]
MTAPTYDPSIIERFASQLYERASNIIWKWGCIGMSLGALMAMLIIQSFGDLTVPWRVGVFAVSVFVGLLAGRSIGTDRAFSLWFQAQTALCQAAIERNTRRT